MRRTLRFGPEPEERLAWLLILLNLLVALMWWILGQSAQGRRFMMDHFTVSGRNLKQGRMWTLLTSNYSQIQPMHLFANCLGIYFFCPPVVASLGARRFLALYTVGGVCSSFAHLLMHRRDPNSPALGASGALNAVCTSSFRLKSRGALCVAACPVVRA